MRETLLIAWREYRQYVFSRGFLLLLVIAPIGLAVVGMMMSFAAGATPVRYFVVVDQNGFYVEEIDEYFERRQRSDLLAAWDRYVLLNVRKSLSDSDIDPVFNPTAQVPNRTDVFFDKGGIDAARTALTPLLRSEAEQFVPPEAPYQRLPLTAGLGTQSESEMIESLRPYLRGDAAYPGAEGAGLFAALILPNDFGTDSKTLQAAYWAQNHVDRDLRDMLNSAMTLAHQKRISLQSGLSEDDFQNIVLTRAQLIDFRPDRQADQAELDLADRVQTTLPAFMAYVLFILIFSVGSLLLTNTIEERSNKIVETLLSSVTANQLMMGKLIGIGAVGLTIPTVGVMLTAAAALTVFSGNEIVTEVVSALIFSPLVWVYLFYFLCGYVIFAMIYLAIGAISNSIQDAQTFLGPVTLVVMAPFPLMAFVFQEPNGLIASIMTWIPIYTPYAVMLRAASDPPMWEIIGATLLMLAFGAVFVTIMGRIFRRGLLNDSPPNLRSLLKLAGREKT